MKQKAMGRRQLDVIVCACNCLP